MRQYLVHEYKVECSHCGYSQINNDDNVSPNVVLVVSSHCPKCCKTDRVPYQQCFAAGGELVLVWLD